MKQLNADGTVTIPSNLPRTRSGPDSRGIRLCFAELGRSCSLGQGFLIFTDGSAYSYDAPSNTPIEALCEQFQRGKVFNFSVRRSRGGFVKGFTPPPDYETIYTFPPYEGVTPSACGVPTFNWNSLAWSTLVQDSGTPTGSASVISAAGNSFDIEAQGAPPTPGGPGANPFIAIEGVMSYTGPAVACNVDFNIINSGAGPTFVFFQVAQDGNALTIDGAGNFMIADTMGVASSIVVDAQVVGQTGDSDIGSSSGGGEMTGVFTPAS